MRGLYAQVSFCRSIVHLRSPDGPSARGGLRRRARDLGWWPALDSSRQTRNSASVPPSPAASVTGARIPRDQATAWKRSSASGSLAGGDQDQDDADPLRSDPLFQLVCGQLAVSGRDLASQPPTNPRREALAQDLRTEAVAQRRATGAEKGRLISEAPDQVGSWDRARRGIYKAGALPQGPNPRFVVTTKTDPPRRSPTTIWIVAKPSRGSTNSSPPASPIA
jgi:hypothetical protein